MASGVVILLTQPPPWRPSYPLRPLSLISPSSYQYRRSWRSQYRRWDSNAETGRSQRFGFDFRGKRDEDEYRDEEEYEEGFYKGNKRRWWSDESPEMEEGPGILEEAIDSLWILKVFKSYGWMLPVIFASWLLASGPKAFLMALAIPLAQSALAFAFDKLWGKSKSKPKRRRARVRKRQSASTVTDTESEREEDEDQEPRRQKMGYQSWVVGDEVPVDKGGQNENSFGGWDDLERAKSAARPSRMRGGSGRTATDKGKLGRRERKSDTPLLLRLLIAFFPFLGSWTKMF
ncbi:uncharacterized protein LOC133819699 [Humulus lupulus]|uniref:uncharacterized protein LOC133819699 n=1 Tax=Humulus lupulus TaxID=3486 RepID=UPI002B4089D2|nr:uncharacterized protein LOC133819699 [Humulus lupulus]